MVVDFGNGLQIKPRTMNVRENDLKLILEQMVDFESFIVNGYSLREYFEGQWWMPYFEIFNGPTYPYLVNDFWVRAEVFDEVFVAYEVREKFVEDE